MYESHINRLKTAGFTDITPEINDIICYKDIEIGGVQVRARGYYYTERSGVEPKHVGTLDLDGLMIGDADLYYLLSEEQKDEIARSLIDAPVSNKVNPIVKELHESVKVGGVHITVQYDHSPKEPMTQDYPGAEETFTLNEVNCNGVDITNLLSESSMESLSEKVQVEIADRHDPDALRAGRRFGMR